MDALKLAAVDLYPNFRFGTNFSRIHVNLRKFWNWKIVEVKTLRKLKKKKKWENILSKIVRDCITYCWTKKFVFGNASCSIIE